MEPGRIFCSVSGHEERSKRKATKVDDIAHEHIEDHYVGNKMAVVAYYEFVFESIRAMWSSKTNSEYAETVGSKPRFRFANMPSRSMLNYLSSFSTAQVTYLKLFTV